MGRATILLGWLMCVCAFAFDASAQANETQSTEAPSVEMSRRVTITFGHGLARIETRVEARSRSDVRREVEIEIPIPHAAAFESARYCIRNRCRTAVPDRSDESLSAYELALVAARSGGPARPIGRVTSTGQVDAAPLSRSEPLDIVVSYVAPIEVHGGHAWLRLALGDGPSEVSATGYGEAPRVAGDAGPWAMTAGGHVLVTAELPAGQRFANAWRFQCGAETCTRIWVAAGAAPVPRAVFLAVDASPSMQEVGDGRTLRAVDAVLSALPQGSTVVAAAFGTDVEMRVARPTAPREVSPRSLLAPPASLGRTTGLSAVLAQATESLGGRPGHGAGAPLIVLVTDGRLVSLPPTQGIPVSVVNVSRFPSRIVDAVTARGGVTVELGPAMDDELAQPLAHRLGALTAPTVHTVVELPEGDAAPLLAGEAMSWNGRGLHAPRGVGRTVRPRAPPAALTRGLMRMLQEDLGLEHAYTFVAVDRRSFEATAEWAIGGARTYPRVPGAVAVDRRVSSVVFEPPCDPASVRGRMPECGAARPPRVPTIHGCYAEVRGSISREVIARLLSHARPGVRACMATARRGRPDWTASFSYRLILGHQEIMAAAIVDASPSVDASLRQCLLGRPLESMVVPAVRNEDGGFIVVNYPFHTERQPAQIHVELDADSARLLDRISSGQPR